MGLTIPDAITLFGGCLVVVAAILKLIPYKSNNGKYLRMDVFTEINKNTTDRLDKIDKNITRVFQLLNDKK